MDTPRERTVSIQAWYFDDTLDLKKFRAANPHYPVLNQDPLILELEKGRYGVLTKFGGVVFWNYDASCARRLRDEIYAFIEDRSFDERLDEQIPVVIGAEQDEVLPNSVRLVKEDLLRVNVTTRVIAQSVALERLEYRLDDILEPLVDLVEDLRDHGGVKETMTRLNKMIGMAMAAKHAIIRNLTLFDKPDEVWESPDLDRLYRQLFDVTFDMTDRLRAMDRKLGYAQEVVTLLLETIHTRRALWLEFTIVMLIVIEILFNLFASH